MSSITKGQGKFICTRFEWWEKKQEDALRLSSQKKRENSTSR
jgi:hypothetical protein